MRYRGNFPGHAGCGFAHDAGDRHVVREQDRHLYEEWLRRRRRKRVETAMGVLGAIVMLSLLVPPIYEALIWIAGLRNVD